MAYKRSSMELIRIREYLSPRLKDLYDDAIRLEMLISRMEKVAQTGILPPISLREDVMNTIETMKNNLLFLIKRHIKDAKKVKEFEERMAHLEKTTEEYKANMLKLSLVGDPKQKSIQLLGYLSAYATFYRSYILPIFEAMAKKMVIDESKFWEPIEKEFVEEAYNKMGIRLVEEETTLPRRRE